MKPFLPPNLPPKINYLPLVKNLGEARAALGKLDGLLINLPNPRLLIAPLLTKEAVLSSQIEGTRATLENVFQYEAEEKTSEKNENEKDSREIINYRKAINMAMSDPSRLGRAEADLPRFRLGTELLRKLHYILLDSVRGEDKNRGHFRVTQVFIGFARSTIKEAIYVPPPPQVVPRLLENWENYLRGEMEKDPLIQIGVAHYQFEAIHPFVDGNGRIGRLLIPLFLTERKLLSFPLLYISEYFEERRRLYYDLLNGVSRASQWEDWLKFFLDAITLQSTKTQATILKMLVLHNKLKEKILTLNSAYALNLLDILFASPVATFPSLRKQLVVKSPQTIFNLLAKFKELGILKEVSSKHRGKIFVFKDLIEILK